MSNNDGDAQEVLVKKGRSENVWLTKNKNQVSYYGRH